MFVATHTWERPCLCMKQVLTVKVELGRMIHVDVNDRSMDFIPLSQVISARKGEFETGFERGGQTRWGKSILVWCVYVLLLLLLLTHVKCVCRLWHITLAFSF